MIGVIADDLSGAAELGAVGWRHGLRAVVVMDGRADGEADLVCMDTDSRGCGAAEAAARVKAAARALKAAGARWIYKKADSVLRGNVRAEIQAVMEELHLRRALLVPANPSLGRIIRDGKYFVGGRLLHETEFARDPHHPRKSSVVVELLRAAGEAQVNMCKPEDALGKSGLMVGEAETAEDLQTWAARADEETLMAGAANFFAALLAIREKNPAGAKPQGDKSDLWNSGNHAEFFVCGSTSESSRKFIEMSRGKGVAVHSLPEELGAGGEFGPAKMEEIANRAAAELKQGRRVILNVGLPLMREEGRGRMLAAHLVDVAALVLQRAEAGRVYAEGGETAAALARKMGWGRLTILRELAQGVVAASVAGQRDLRFTLKPGTYAWPEEIIGL